MLLVFQVPFIRAGHWYFYYFRPALFLVTGCFGLAISSQYTFGKKREISAMIMVAILAATLQISLAVLWGVAEGFGKSPYDHTFKGILLNLWLIGTEVFGTEYFRAWFIRQFGRKAGWATILMATLLSAAILVPWGQMAGLKKREEIVLSLGLTVLPSVFQNFLCSYVASVAGPVPPLIYRGTLLVFERFSPILPDLSWATSVLSQSVVPIIGFVLALDTHVFFDRPNRRKLNTVSVKSALVTGIMAIMIVWFSVGILPYYPAVVATGSMEPAIYPGDIVICKKLPGSVKPGDIINFYSEGEWVVHRVIRAVTYGSFTFYYTKGDANPVPDRDPVDSRAVRGKVVWVIPRVGLITLKFRQMTSSQMKGLWKMMPLSSE